MSTMRQSGLVFVLPEGWLDITSNLPAGSPLTLGKADGVGVIQFSVARYASGALPEIGVSDLTRMLEAFAKANELGPPRRRIEEGRVVVGEFDRTNERITAWYVSNGRDVAFVTYVAQLDDPRVEGELRDASALVASLDFDSPS